MAFIEPMHRNKPNITYLLTLCFCIANDKSLIMVKIGLLDIYELLNTMCIHGESDKGVIISMSSKQISIKMIPPWTFSTLQVPFIHT